MSHAGDGIVESSTGADGEAPRSDADPTEPDRHIMLDLVDKRLPTDEVMNTARAENMLRGDLHPLQKQGQAASMEEEESQKEEVHKHDHAQPQTADLDNNHDDTQAPDMSRSTDTENVAGKRERGEIEEGESGASAEHQRSPGAVVTSLTQSLPPPQTVDEGAADAAPSSAKKQRTDSPAGDTFLLFACTERAAHALTRNEFHVDPGLTDSYFQMQVPL